MKLHHKVCALVCAVLFVCATTGCAAQPDMTVPASTSKPVLTTPAPPVSPALPIKTTDDEQQDINARTVTWLKQSMEKDVRQQKIGNEESKKLNDLACRLSYIGTYFNPDELEKQDILYILYHYYQLASDEGALKYGAEAVLSSEKASALIRNIIGIDIPNASANYGDEEDGTIICRDGMYYIYPSDLEYPEYYLSASQYLGDDIFYLSFDVDDRWTAGAESSKKGIVADDCRMLVKRSDFEWGFTVLSKLKDGDETILPDDFPPPKYSIAYEPENLT
ncbi:MAG TPA: hypothetical protein VN366_11790 [Feifaniaceae bacterium]|nr:hypothetical protein [Feifaniaceae bacterium]